tara:strand:+ start:46464 stop:47072 length:609 start_codon:yes stop_codon:yes gene_type:complete
MGNPFHNRSTILKFMKLKIIFFIVLVTQILSAQKGARIGYIDMDLILENIDEYKIAKKIIDQKIVVWKKEIELQKIQLKRYQDELNSERVLLTQELIADRNNEINDFASGIIFLQEKRFGPKGDLIKERLKLIKPIQDQVMSAVRDIAKEKRYDFIFDRSSDLVMLYSTKNYDISQLVLRKINIQERNKARKKLLEERNNKN